MLTALTAAQDTPLLTGRRCDSPAVQGLASEAGARIMSAHLAAGFFQWKRWALASIDAARLLDLAADGLIPGRAAFTKWVEISKAAAGIRKALMHAAVLLMAVLLTAVLLTAVVELAVVEGRQRDARQSCRVQNLESTTSSVLPWGRVS